MYIIPAYNLCDMNFAGAYVSPAFNGTDMNFGVDGPGVAGRRRFFMGAS